MKWGVRRTPEQLGRKKPSEKALDRQRKKQMKKNVKRRRLLSDQELSYAISRIEKEKRLRELTREEIGYGKKRARSVLSSIGSKTLMTVASGASIYAVKYAITKEFNPKEFAGYVAPKPKNK